MRNKHWELAAHVGCPQIRWARTGLLPGGISPGDGHDISGLGDVLGVAPKLAGRPRPLGAQPSAL